MKAIAMRLEGDSAFYADGRLLDSVRSASIRRTLGGLISRDAWHPLTYPPLPLDPPHAKYAMLYRSSGLPIREAAIAAA